MEASRLSYSSLKDEQDEIRLLHLSRKITSTLSEGEESLECHLSTVSLSDEPTYEALSYVWGDPQVSNQVLIDDAWVCITSNLHGALSQLQLPDRERTLWVDALCINQGDNVERSLQVVKMKRIFSLATSVVVYLGPAWPGSEDAIVFFETIGNIPKLHYSSALSPHVTVKGLDTSSEELRRSIIQFLDLAWWKRVWTVQEFLLARNIVFQCGPQTIPGILVLDSLATMNEHGDGCCSVDMCFSTLDAQLGLRVWEAFSPLEILKSNERFPEFLDKVSIFRTRNSFDPRDKIYGMLGLAQGRWVDWITPDYTQSTESVYRALVTRAVTNMDKLSFLSHCYHVRNATLDLPSYVPDWTVSKDEISHSYHLNRVFVMDLFNASRGTKPDFKIQTPIAATSKGFVFDKVKIIEDAHIRLNPMTTRKYALSHWRGLASINWRGGLSGHETDGAVLDLQQSTMTSLERAFRQTMCGSIRYRESTRWRRTVEDGDWSGYEKWEAWYNARHDHINMETAVQYFEKAHVTVSSGRRFAITERGLMGFVPVTTVEGDAVAILAGGDVPYILRQCHTGTSDGDSTAPYTFIGDAYVHGIMDGEAVTDYSLTFGDVTLV